MDIDGNVMLNNICVRHRARHVYLIRVAENGIHWLFLVTMVRTCLFRGGWRVSWYAIPVCPEVSISRLLMFERLALYPYCLYVKRYKVFQLVKRVACRIRINPYPANVENMVSSK